MSLIELCISLVVLAIGILAVGRLFPAGARSQAQDRLLISANYYAQERVEDAHRTDLGRRCAHGRPPPAGIAFDTLGTGQWLRCYNVTTMTGKLDNLKKVDVTVNYWGAGQAPRSLTATTYVRR
jgi:Tfp pilus assembly protein PilV